MPYNKPIARPQNLKPSKNKLPQTITIGSSLEINIDPCSCASEVRADVVVSQFTSVRLWGQILNCNNEPVPNALVKLVKISCQGEHKDYEGIAHTHSDCQGFYQFDICSDENAWYKVLVGKSTTGKEIIVASNPNNNCSPHANPYECDPDYDPDYDYNYNYDYDENSPSDC